MAKLEAKFVSGKENCSWLEAKTMFVSEQQTSSHFHNICSQVDKLVDITGQDVHFHSVCVHVFWKQTKNLKGPLNTVSTENKT